MNIEILKQMKNLTNAQKMAINNCIAIFKVGSQLYGTNIPTSDTDYEGIFIEEPDHIIGTNRCDEVDFSTNKTNKRNTENDIDLKLFSLRKFFSLAKQNNPNKIELFFIPEDKYIFKTKIWETILNNKHLFISKKLKFSFSGYAFSQRNKLLTKKQRLNELKEFKLLLENGLKNNHKIIGDMDLCETVYHKKYDKEKDQLIQMPKKKLKYDFKHIKYKMTQEGTDAILVNEKEYNYGMNIEKLYNYITKEIDKYGGRTEFLKEYGFDVKFAMHMFRLFEEAKELLTTGEIKFPLNNRHFLLDIRNGKYSLDNLIEMSEDLDNKINNLYDNSKIQYSCNEPEINNLQIKLILDYWKCNGQI